MAGSNGKIPVLFVLVDAFLIFGIFFEKCVTTCFNVSTLPHAGLCVSQ